MKVKQEMLGKEQMHLIFNNPMGEHQNLWLFFYNYPTAIGLEYHKPLKEFNLDIGDNAEIMYGMEDRMYFNILFGF